VCVLCRRGLFCCAGRVFVVVVLGWARLGRCTVVWLAVTVPLATRRALLIVWPVCFEIFPFARRECKNILRLYKIYRILLYTTINYILSTTHNHLLMTDTQGRRVSYGTSHPQPATTQLHQAAICPHQLPPQPGQLRGRGEGGRGCG
jgi:hypothetical protein